MTDTETPDKWLEPPIITALSDAPLDDETFLNDDFGLGRTMGPLYDILRHPQTQTPLSIGIYGDWGSGKSTAMHWLQDRLAHWTANGPDEPNTPKVKVYSTWFYPWKYDNKEDVWRGLIAEVLLACVNQVEGTSAETWTNMAKGFGKFLGKSFVHVLSSVTLKGAGAEVSMAELVKVLDEAADFVEPSRAYLNQFETVLETAVRDTLGNTKGKPPKNRLVIFIDDLDRCLPQVALQVLEALKLYLNIPDLVFVLGVDDSVINELVIKHYDDLGLSKAKSQQYLAKMFQVEVPIAPMEQKLDDFLQKQIKDNPSWKGLALDDKATDIFCDTILALAGGVPREIKRLVNYCLMAGRGVQMVDDTDDDITSDEAIQFYLLHKALGRHGKRNILTFKAGQHLFYEASRGMTETPDSNDTHPTFTPSHSEILKRLVEDKADAILSDTIIRRLLKLPFPTPDRLGGLAQGVQMSIDTRSWAEVVEVALGGIKWTNATAEDFAKVKKLDFHFSDITDLRPLMRFKNLEALNLDFTSVKDLAPIAELKTLKDLDLAFASVEDLRPISGLKALKHLDLSFTEVEDLHPIATLKNLKFLSLTDTKSLRRQTEALKKDISGLEVYFI